MSETIQFIDNHSSPERDRHPTQLIPGAYYLKENGELLIRHYALNDALLICSKSLRKRTHTECDQFGSLLRDQILASRTMPGVNGLLLWCNDSELVALHISFRELFADLSNQAGHVRSGMEKHNAHCECS